MRVITLARTKALLGISDTSQDAAISAAIPFVDSAVKQITSNNWNQKVLTNTTTDSAIIDMYADIAAIYDDLHEYVKVGQLISGDGIPDDTYISEIEYNYPLDSSSTSTYFLTVTMSANATETNTGNATYLGIPIAYQKTIALGVYWYLSNLSTTIIDDTWISRSMDGVSVTRGTSGNKIDSNSGMPMWFANALPKYHTGH